MVPFRNQMSSLGTEDTCKLVGLSLVVCVVVFVAQEVSISTSRIRNDIKKIFLALHLLLHVHIEHRFLNTILHK